MLNNGLTVQPFPIDYTEADTTYCHIGALSCKSWNTCLFGYKRTILVGRVYNILGSGQLSKLNVTRLQNPHQKDYIIHKCILSHL